MAKELKDHNYNGIDATIVADSVNEFGDRLTTFVVTFPRIILAEFNTHRMFSRNSASSRAIPFKKMVEMVKENPFMPVAFQREHKGMQGTEYLDEERSSNAASNWFKACEQAIETSKIIHDNYYGDDESRVTKQLCNRLLEPFMWHTVIVTSSEYENFFKLRCPQYRVGGKGDINSSTKLYRSKKDAIKDYPNTITEPDINWMYWNEGMGEIHIMTLAEKMWDEYNENTPKQLKAGEWHIPFGDQIDYQKLLRAMVILNQATGTGHPEEDIDECMRLTIEAGLTKVSIARCARISYGTFEGKEDYEADIKLYDKLNSSGHFSPFEHVAKSMTEEEYSSFYKGFGANEGHIGRKENLGWCNNFKGFIQERYYLENS